ncbi:unnamed protein product [Thlaspi arvense]|uniref:Uncharacterized protein n=1 Tax=Thlaspi arvense TaxID=13288 RepID=A0AAU9SNW7_THLAR|nr:unnamed protein product [Thlaspi arvense]
MAVSLGIVVVPSCSGDRLFSRPNFPAICSVSSTAYFRLWRGRINAGTGVNSARRRRDVGGLLISSCLSPDSSSPPSSLSGPKTKLYVSGKFSVFLLLAFLLHVSVSLFDPNS